MSTESGTNVKEVIHKLKYLSKVKISASIFLIISKEGNQKGTIS